MRSGGRAVGAGEMVVVGDEYRDDYVGPREVGMTALLLRRPVGADEGEVARAIHRPGKASEEEGAETVASLVEVVDYVKRVNQAERW